MKCLLFVYSGLFTHSEVVWRSHASLTLHVFISLGEVVHYLLRFSHLTIPLVLTVNQFDSGSGTCVGSLLIELLNRL